MPNYTKIGTKICSSLINSSARTASRVTRPAVKSVQRLAGHEANIDLIRRTTLCGAKRSSRIYNYLPQNVQENFTDVLAAGRRLGYIKVDKNGNVLGQSLERFLTVLDRDSYSKMLFLEQNFRGLDKASFKKLLSAFKTPQKMAENRENIQRWLKVKDELRSYSETIAKDGADQVAQAEKDIFEIFGIKPKVRSKGVESIFDKLSRKVLKGKEINSIEKARGQIGDLVGTRVVLEDVSEANMQKIVDRLCNGIESGRIKITDIENYAKASQPYFTQAQFNQIKQSAARKGYEIAAMKHVKQSGSGYVTAQMDIVYSNGARGELQIRGKNMNKYADREHIPYDIRQGKNLGKNIPELERFYEPVEDAVTSLKRNGLDKIYDKYILDCYKYIRKHESGRIKGQFKLPQFPKRLHGYEILSFNNLGKIHSEAKKIQEAAESIAKAA